MTKINNDTFNKEPCVSVVMPVYNAEKYLIATLNSLVSQTLKNIEIICVDDGSTDSSFEILTEFAKRDNRIKLLKQHNRYAGVARNNGLKTAKGETKHLNLNDSDMNYKDLLKAMKKFDIKGALVCESPNIETDAKILKNYYLSL